MNDNELFGLELTKDGELTPLGIAFVLTVHRLLVEHIAHIIFNHTKEGDHND